MEDGYTWGLVSPWGVVHAIWGAVFDSEAAAREHMRATFALLAKKEA